MNRRAVARMAGYVWVVLFLVRGSGPAAFAGVPSSASTRDEYRIVEDFSSSPIDSLPKGWSWRDKDEDKPKLYRVEEIDGHRYLAAQDTGSSVILLKRVSWNPQEYPIMTWCWKVDALPSGADERHTETNDSAAGVYVIFSTNWLGIPRQLKYVWSTSLPPGTVDRRKGVARPWFVVLESGPAKLGQWVFEQVDLYQDHKRVLKNEPADRTIGIGVLTDADATHSYAQAAYADFRLWPRETYEQGKIKDYCACLTGAAADELPPNPGK